MNFIGEMTVAHSTYLLGRRRTIHIGPSIMTTPKGAIVVTDAAAIPVKAHPCITYPVNCVRTSVATTGRGAPSGLADRALTSSIRLVTHVVMILLILTLVDGMAGGRTRPRRSPIDLNASASTTVTMETRRAARGGLARTCCTPLPRPSARQFLLPRSAATAPAARRRRANQRLPTHPAERIMSRMSLHQLNAPDFTADCVPRTMAVQSTLTDGCAGVQPPRHMHRRRAACPVVMHSMNDLLKIASTRCHMPTASRTSM